MKRPRLSIFLFLLIFLAAADQILGYLFIPPPHQIPHLYYHHDIRPKNFKGKLVWMNKYYTIFTNSLGFKDRANREIKLINDKYRIVLMGDSFTEGVGFPYEETFVGIIDKKMEDKNIEVLNAATGGFFPKLYYLKIKYLIEEIGLRFNALFVFANLSDNEEEVYYKGYIPFNNQIWQRITFVTHKYILSHSLIYNFCYFKIIPQVNVPPFIEQVLGSPVFDKEYIQQRKAWELQDNPYVESTKEGFSLAQENMEKLHDLCKKYGIKMFLVVFPHIKQIMDGNQESPYVIFWRDFCTNNKIDFINCFPVFINGKDPTTVIKECFISGDTHFSENGHLILAQKLLDYFKSHFSDLNIKQ